MRIAIGCDHGGIVLKNSVINALNAKNVEYTDFGTYDTLSVDYTDYAKTVAEKVASCEYDAGILLCGTGIGISIAANKVRGIRAAVCTNVFMASACRAHNNANIICLGGRVVSESEAFDIVTAWLSSSFEGGRHENRLNKIKLIEDENK